MNTWDKLVVKFNEAPLKYKLFALGFVVVLIVAIIW